MSARTPQGSIAWAVSLITLPYISVPAYWVFGRDKFRGYVLAHQHELELIDDVIRKANDKITGVALFDDRQSAAITGAEKMARIPLTSGNNVTLLVDGDATFASIFAGIDAAEEYIQVKFYIVRDDELGRVLKSRLIARAQSGVRVWFVYGVCGILVLP